MTGKAKIGVIGDLHGRWNGLDNRFIDEQGYELLLFLGDLGSGTRRNGLSIVRQIARLKPPAVVMPGNNDAEHLPHLAAEFAHQAGRQGLLRLVRGVAPAGGIESCGYSNHTIRTPGGNVGLIAARPCAMGGSTLSFPELIERMYGVASLEQSAKRLCELVDRAEHEALVFLAHNGPTGVGDAPQSPWSRDFTMPREMMLDPPMDWGDRDLRVAIDYALEQGKRVLGVIAGHMHRRPEDDPRPLRTEVKGIPYFNPALVPRIRSTSEGEVHYFVDAELSVESLELSERWVALPDALRT